MYSDRQALANSIDPDEMKQNATSRQGLHCLPLIRQRIDSTLDNKLYFVQILEQVW